MHPSHQAASHYWTKKIESSAGSLAFHQRWSDFIAIQRNLKFEIGSSLFPLFMIWLEHFYWKRHIHLHWRILNLTFSLAPWSFSPPPASFEWQPPLIRIRPQTPKDVDDQLLIWVFLSMCERRNLEIKRTIPPLMNFTSIGNKTTCIHINDDEYDDSIE